MPLNDNEKNLMKYAKTKPKIEPIKIPLVLFKFKLSETRSLRFEKKSYKSYC